MMHTTKLESKIYLYIRKIYCCELNLRTQLVVKSVDKIKIDMTMKNCNYYRNFYYNKFFINCKHKVLDFKVKNLKR